MLKANIIMKGKALIKKAVRPFFVWAAPYFDWIIAPAKEMSGHSHFEADKTIHLPVAFNRKKPFNTGNLHWKFLDNAAGITSFTEQTFCRELSNARVVGSNGAIISSKNKLILDLSPELGAINGEHTYFQLLRFSKPYLINGSSLLMTAPIAATNYFHWMTDALPRLGIALQAGYKLADFNHFIVSAADLAYQRESLVQIGVPANQILSMTERPYVICEKLIAPSPPCLSGNVSPWIIDFLRSQFSSWMVADTTLAKKIFISRKHAGKRRLQNENEIANEFKKDGFVEVSLESLSVSEQVKLFYNSESIAGVHGAGFANLVFCRPGTEVLEVFPESYVNQCYWTIASINQLNYGYALGTGVKETVEGSHLQDCDFKISIQEIYDIRQLIK